MRFAELPIGTKFIYDNATLVKIEKMSTKISCCRSAEWNAVSEDGRRLLINDEVEIIPQESEQ